MKDPPTGPKPAQSPHDARPHSEHFAWSSLSEEVSPVAPTSIYGDLRTVLWSNGSMAATAGMCGAGDVCLVPNPMFLAERKGGEKGGAQKKKKEGKKGLGAVRACECECI